MAPRYVVGIDLGTTHTSLAYADLEADDAARSGGRTTVLPVPQLVAQGKVEARPLVPSFLYFAHESEGAQALPWDGANTTRDDVVGEYARARGSDAPARVVASAKSWLCHPAVDRRGPLLPLGAPEDITRVSPVEASRRYVRHLVEAWDWTIAKGRADLALGAQDVVLTVPASFDAAARELTVEAARAAGLENVTLLEEPQAALYAWVDALGDTWRKELRIGDLLLVVDVGGGTTDFSAIVALDRGGSLELSRVAVGDHILLGGDNMDLALAHVVRAKLAAAGKEIDRWQMTALTHACRAAKEALVAEMLPPQSGGTNMLPPQSGGTNMLPPQSGGTNMLPPQSGGTNVKLASVPIALAGRGLKLLGGGLRTELLREEVTRTLVDGFFPEVPASARPASRARAALTQLGLPYASDPAVTRHLAAFLARQAGAVSELADFAEKNTGTLLHPTAILFNGGVMKGAVLRDRLVATLNAWLASEGAPPVRVLGGADLDLAVARGAASYGLARRGKGLRIRGGTARAYYVGIEGAVPAVPGLEPPITALCVAPFGMEEGTHAALPPHELGVVVGEKVRFRFFGSSVRREDKAGAELERWKDGELEELSPIEVTLPAEGRREGDIVPALLESRVTEVGTLVLEAVPAQPRAPGEKWNVELSVREDAALRGPS